MSKFIMDLGRDLIFLPKTREENSELKSANAELRKERDELLAECVALRAVNVGFAQEIEILKKHIILLLAKLNILLAQQPASAGANLQVIDNNFINNLDDVQRGLDKQIEQEMLDRHNQPLFDNKTGTWRDAASGLRYCPACKVQHNQLSPLKESEQGWTCGACKAFLKNPEYIDTFFANGGQDDRFGGF